MHVCTQDHPGAMRRKRISEKQMRTRALKVRSNKGKTEIESENECIGRCEKQKQKVSGVL